jgi:hypothetical protein
VTVETFQEQRLQLRSEGAQGGGAGGRGAPNINYLANCSTAALTALIKVTTSTLHRASNYARARCC